MKRITAAIIAAMLAMLVCMACAPRAEALNAVPAKQETVSLPYVDDVNPCKGGYTVTVTCAGNAKSYAMKVTDERGKSAKVTKHAKRVWTVTMKRGHVYKIAVKGACTSWKSIRYGID